MFVNMTVMKAILKSSFRSCARGLGIATLTMHHGTVFRDQLFVSELNVDNWNDNCEAKSEAESPRPLRGLQVDFSLTRNVSYAVR